MPYLVVKPCGNSGLLSSKQVSEINLFGEHSKPQELINPLENLGNHKEP